MKSENIIIPLFFILLILFTVYGYSQVDLNLTLSSNSVYQSFQKQLTYLGYYNRGLSSIFHIFFILSFFLIYKFFLNHISDLFSPRKIYMYIVGMIMIFFFAYPAVYSYDIYNYLFDARIITKYNLNPYEHAALDFQGDLWTRFMRWTHRKYPYGPMWLLLTVPLVWAGMEKFIPTLILFKLLFSACFAINVFLIHKIMKIVDSKNALASVVFFAFNPLVFTESLVSPHLDSAMLTFLLLGLYALVKKNKFLGFLSMLFSGGIKFATWAVLPILFLKKNFKVIFQFAYISVIVATVVMIYVRQPYPWYFIPLIGVASLSAWNPLIKRFTIGLSFIISFQYLTFIYSGTYNTALDQVNKLILYGPVILLGLYCLPLLRKNKTKYVNQT